ncbi:hypothetical protein TNCV_851181 [Trichonephila clavipes]|nr:hypothetical protein TNCV_851181 [Trichonephila clavipes]
MAEKQPSLYIAQEAHQQLSFSFLRRSIHQPFLLQVAISKGQKQKDLTTEVEIPFDLSCLLGTHLLICKYARLARSLIVVEEKKEAPSTSQNASAAADDEEDEFAEGLL